jgi:glucose-1-phosphate thymidylyltransferase
MKKGIILAGGHGTRLRPLTQITNKHLIPVYDRPMIMYPIETLKALGINDILLVSGGEHIGGFADFLGDGCRFGVNLTYRVQEIAGGIADALTLSKDFVRGEEHFAVILGDNIFDNKQISQIIPDIDIKKDKAYLFLKAVTDPERFGVPVLNPGTDSSKKPIIVKIEEKPQQPLSDYAVTGLYIYPQTVFEILPTLVPSNRNELEITDVNNRYVNAEAIDYFVVDDFWSDAGTFDSLNRSANWAKKFSPLDK